MSIFNEQLFWGKGKEKYQKASFVHLLHAIEINRIQNALGIYDFWYIWSLYHELFDKTEYILNSLSHISRKMSINAEKQKHPTLISTRAVVRRLFQSNVPALHFLRQWIQYTLHTIYMRLPIELNRNARANAWSAICALEHCPRQRTPYSFLWNTCGWVKWLRANRAKEELTRTDFEWIKSSLRRCKELCVLKSIEITSEWHTHTRMSTDFLPRKKRRIRETADSLHRMVEFETIFMLNLRIYYFHTFRFSVLFTFFIRLFHFNISSFTWRNSQLTVTRSFHFWKFMFVSVDFHHI